jgi:hypothetical protein
LTNAPTPALKSLYQGRLRELDEARDVLLAAPPADATSDLPTDQPSIPDKAAPEPPREPPKPPEKPAPKPPAEREPSRATSEANPGRTRNIRIGMAIGVVVVILGVVKLISGRSTNPSDSPAAVAAAYPGYADSLRAIREDLTVARLEFNRGEPDYATISQALDGADRVIASLPASATADTTVARLKTQLAQQRASVNKSCDMLKRIATQRGEAIPKCGS